MKTTTWMEKHLPAIIFIIEKSYHKKVLKEKDVDSVLKTLAKMKETFFPLTAILQSENTEDLYAYAERAAFSSRQASFIGGKTSSKKAKTSAANGKLSSGRPKLKVS